MYCWDEEIMIFINNYLKLVILEDKDVEYFCYYFLIYLRFFL